MSVRRIKNHGKWVYQARVAYQGRRRAAFRATRDEARQAEADLLRDLKAEAADAEAVAQRPATLRQLFDFYVSDLEARGKGPDTIGRAVDTAHVVERLFPALLDVPASRVTVADVFAFRQARAGEGIKASTINRGLRTLRAMLNRGVPGYRFPANAFLPEDETRVRWLRPEDEALVFATMPSPFRELAKLAGLTLMRLSELRLLKREMVRLEQGVVMLPRAKAGARAVVLSTEAQGILRELLAGRPGEYVFAKPDGTPFDRSYVGRVFRHAARAAGLRDFHFHDLRHHGATMALNRGFSGPIVMALGGWKTERMMRRYAAVTDATLRAAAEAVSGAPLLQTTREVAAGSGSGVLTPR